MTMTMGSCYDNAWVIGLSTGAYRVFIYEWK